MIQTKLNSNGRLDVVIDAPPVNAFSTVLLQKLAEILRNVSSETRVVVLRAEGRGFSAGGDIKEMDRLPSHVGIIRQIRDGLNACVAIEACPVPVIVVVHGYVIGIGVLLVGVSDLIVAEQGTRFILAEVDNGAVSGAVQAAALLPEKRVRAAMLTGATVFVEEMLSYGSVHSVVSGDRLVEEANAIAEIICAKVPAVVRALKESLTRTFNRDLVSKYRAEASYTYELHLTGDANKARSSWWTAENTGESQLHIDAEVVERQINAGK